MLTEFANGTVLYSHNQRYGEWVVHKVGEPLPAKQIRLIITTQKHQTVLVLLSTVPSPTNMSGDCLANTLE
jgi:formamidopyrimidine-DNA glycosylase